MLAKIFNRKKAAPESLPDRGTGSSLTLVDVPSEAAPRAVWAAIAPKFGKDRSGRWDWMIASVCISAGVVGLRTVNDPLLWSEFSRGNSGSQPIGKLIKKRGGVRFRSATSLLWHDLYSGSEEVAAGDTVFTGNDGMAELQLQDGSVAEIEPNSLVVVQRSVDVLSDQNHWFGSFFATTKAESLLRIEKGAAKVNLKADSSPMRVQVKGKVYNLSSQSGAAAAEVSVDTVSGENGGVKFASLSAGSLELSEVGAAGASSLQFGKGQQAVLGNGKAGDHLSLQSVMMNLLLPVAGQQLMQPSNEWVTFGWKWEGDPTTEVALEIESEVGSDGSRSANQSLSVKGGAEQAKVALAAGDYRWRLSASGPTGAKASRVETPWRSFELLSLSPPQPIGPLAGARIGIPRGDAQASVLFSWAPLPSGLEAEIEWSRKATEDAHVVVGQAGGIQLGLSAGTYQWRVRARSLDRGQTSAWSTPLELSVRSESEVSDGKPGEATSVVLTPAQAAVAVLPEKPAIAPTSEVKKPAPTRALPRSKPLKVLALSSASGSTKLGSSERLDQILVPLNWKEIEDAVRYQVIVTDDLSRKTVLNKTTQRSSLSLALHSLVSTRFTYQVTAVMANGEKVASAPVLIEIQLSAPILKTPPDGTRVAPGKGGSMLVTWERTVLTDSYIVQISTDPSFRKSVRVETAQRNLLSLRGLSMDISYYWRVQSVSHGHKSEWSQSSLFVLDQR